MKAVQIFVVTAALVAASMAPAAAIDGTPFVGAVMGEHGINPVPGDACPDVGEGGWQFFSSGEGRILRIGRVSYELVQCTDPTGDTPVSVGTIVFTTRHGDTLTVAQEATSTIHGDPAGPPDGFTLRGTWTVIDGSGRFAGATGFGRMFGIGDVDVPTADGVPFRGVPDGKVVFTFVGRIHLFDD